MQVPSQHVPTGRRVPRLSVPLEPATVPTVLLLAGVLEIGLGVKALTDDGAVTAGLAPATWGWIVLGIGLATALPALGLHAGARWAGGCAVAIASLAVWADFFLLSFHPAGAVVGTVLGTWVIVAITRPRQLRA